MRILLPILALLLISPGLRGEDMGLYVGGSIGNAQLAINNNYFGQGFDDINLDDSTTAWKGYAGLQVLPFLSVEAGYTHFGGIDNAIPAADSSLDADTLAVFARGIMPLGPVQLFGKLGYHFYDADVAFDSRSGDLSFNENESGRELAVGAGAGFEIGDITIRAEYEVFLVNDLDDLSLISVGATYSF